MAKLLTFIVFLVTPLTLTAQVYRCETAQGTIYSQMPCSESAERLTEYDPAGEEEQVAEEAEPEAVAQPEVREPANSMAAFVSTLEKQRQDQFTELDGEITEVRLQLGALADDGTEEEPRRVLEDRLEDLVVRRRSIDEQYESLIDEANARAAVQSPQ